ncbi:hypothetical protein ACOMHN_059461 [Nucella lapillus]
MKMAVVGASTSSVVLLLLLLLPSLMLYLTPVCGQAVQFSDPDAGRVINRVAVKGMQVAMAIRERFLTVLNTLDATLSEAEQTLASQLSTNNLPNLTALMEDHLAVSNSIVNEAESLAHQLNLTEQDEGQAVFFMGSQSFVNVKEAYADSKFTVPMTGLYMITAITKGLYQGVETKIMRNGNETIAKLETYEYYSSAIYVHYIGLRWLNKNDEIYTTGDALHTFAVNLLRMQALMP